MCMEEIYNREGWERDARRKNRIKSTRNKDGIKLIIGGDLYARIGDRGEKEWEGELGRKSKYEILNGEENKLVKSLEEMEQFILGGGGGAFINYEAQFLPLFKPPVPHVFHRGILVSPPPSRMLRSLWKAPN